MAGAQVIPPFPVFTDVDGNPVDDGYIFVGTEGLDPIASPVPVFWDRALTVPATQPIRTIGGYPSNLGVRSVFYSGSAVYSILVRNKNGTTVYSTGSSLSLTAGQIGWTRSALSAGINTAHQMLDAQTVNLWEFAHLVTNISNYVADPWSCDWSPAITAAFGTGKRVYAPATAASSPYVLWTTVSMPVGVTCHLAGDGDSTLFALNAIMAHVFERIDDASPGALAQVILEDFKLDCIRRADWGLWIESSKKGAVRNITVERFLVGGAMLGSDTAASGYYENKIVTPTFDAGNFYSSTTVGMAAYGLYMGISATDNVVYNNVSAYITEAGIINKGGSNKFYAPHAYGNNATDTGPKYSFDAAQTCEVTNGHNDNPTIAGVRIQSSNVQIIGGTYQWAAGNTPALAGAVPIEISSGLNEVSILGGNIRGENTGNPSIRYLGTKPIDSTVLGVTPFRPAAGEDSGHFVARQLGITPITGFRTQFEIDTPSAQSSAIRFFRGGILRYELNQTSDTESGGSAGTNFLWTSRTDGGATQEFFKYFRQFNLTELIGQVKVGTTNVGFYGTNPVAKPAVTGSRGGNAALASLLTALASQGLITDSTTA